MAFIIPDNILDTLVCDTCSKYLSVKPIMVYPNRRKKCGRCARAKKQSEGVVSLYRVIAEKCLFKCVNRYDGCRELLTYSQTREHEKTCLAKFHNCSICCESVELPTFLLLKHFREVHKETILDSTTFFYNFDKHSESSQVYFYKQEDHLFFINIFSSRSEELIRVHVSFLGDSKEAQMITQHFTVTSENVEFKFTTEIQLCTAYNKESSNPFCIKIPNNIHIIAVKVDITFKYPLLIPVPLVIETNSSFNRSDSTDDSNNLKAGMITFTPMVGATVLRTIFLNSHFRQSFPNITLSKCRYAIIQSNVTYFLHCFNCKEICWRGLSRDPLVQTFYFSLKCKHSICYYCFQLLKQENQVYENDYMISNFHKDIMKNIEFYCKWNCGETFHVNSHLGHEESCQLQPLQPCPESNCNFQGTIVDIANHMTMHPGREICTYSNFYISCLFNRSIFVCLRNHFVELKVVSNQGLSISVVLLEQSHKKNKEKMKPLVLLFDDNKHFLMSFQKSISKNEKNHWIKVILVD